MKTDKPSNDVKIAVLENNTIHIGETLNRIEKRLDKIDERFEKLEKKMDEGFSRIDKKMDDGFKSINNRMWFLYTTMIAGFGSVLYVIAKSFEWIT